MFSKLVSTSHPKHLYGRFYKRLRQTLVKITIFFFSLYRFLQNALLAPLSNDLEAIKKMSYSYLKCSLPTLFSKYAKRLWTKIYNVSANAYCKIVERFWNDLNFSFRERHSKLAKRLKMLNWNSFRECF